MSGTMSAFFRRIFAVALILAGHSLSLAQSHDPNKPTPLGPGVNKGNVDPPAQAMWM
jgi:hypothetical protein